MLAPYGVLQAFSRLSFPVLTNHRPGGRRVGGSGEATTESRGGGGGAGGGKLVLALICLSCIFFFFFFFLVFLGLHRWHIGGFQAIGVESEL